jgi:hypothetical protein
MKFFLAYIVSRDLLRLSTFSFKSFYKPENVFNFGCFERRICVFPIRLRSFNPSARSGQILVFFYVDDFPNFRKICRKME